MGRMSTIAGRLVLTGTMAGLGLWIMVSRAGLAQDAKKEPTVVPAPELPGQIKPAELKDAGSPAATGVPGPAALSDAPSNVEAAPPGVALPPDSGVPAPAPKSTEPAPGREFNPADDQAPAGRYFEQPLGTDDPEKNAQAFAEQNRKMAESQLKTLKEEEARLRARLQKVESGIKRWQALLEALKQSESVSDEALEPIPQQSITRSVPRRAGDAEPAPLEKAAGGIKWGRTARSDGEIRPATPDDVPVLLPDDTTKPR